MFGATGTKNCGNDSKPTGYVTLAYSLNASVALPADCLTTTQWTFAEATNASMSSMIMGVTEDFATGAGGGTGAAPYYYLVGGMSAYVTFGLGNYWTYANIIDMDGLASLAASITGEGSNAEALHKNGTYITGGAGQSNSTNGCHTAIDVMKVAVKTVAVGGFTAAAQDCLDFAMAGYVTTGTPLAYLFYNLVLTVSLTAPVTASSWWSP